MNDYKIDFVKNPRQEDLQFLGDGITKNAKEKKGLDPIDFFAFFIRDKNNQILGGCNGDILYGCVYVGQLWVEASLRGKGYGTKLMLAAENFGRENGCTFSAVNTMDWEALDFYKKLGYEIEFERHGFLKDSIFYFLRKNFIR